MTRVAAVVLAAGASERMGCPKLLLEIGGESLMHRALSEISKVAFAEIVVVLGVDRDAYGSSVANFAVRIVVNESPGQGLGGSLRVGVDALSSDIDAVIFALADRPFVSAEMYEHLIRTHDTTRASIVAGRYGGIVAPPHLIARQLFHEIGTDSSGGRSLIERRSADVHFEEFPAYALADIDTPEDYERLKVLLERNRRV
jgi:molybdenum cofactor cytidylyltransferase